MSDQPEAPPPECPPAPDVPTFEARITDLEARLHAAEAHGAAALARYREARLAASPEVPADLVAGASVEEVDASFERARGIVEAVRARLAAAPPPAPTPAPSPAPRSESGAPFANATPAQRIRAALAERS